MADKQKVKYKEEVTMIPTRQFRTDILVSILGIRYCIEVDGQHHMLPKQILSDIQKNLYHFLY